jgi:hypothetical protein
VSGHVVRILYLALACLHLGIGGAESQESDFPVDPAAIERPRMRAVRVEGPIEIDGRLDDAEWQRATPAGGVWIQTIPDMGMPATERTEVRILYDDENLYFGARLYQSDDVVFPGLGQDYDVANSDAFGIAVDTYHDRQNGFLFAVNPGGAVVDAQSFNDRRDVAIAWEGVFDVRTQISDSSWVVELAIPFATLRFKPIDR